MKAIYSKTIEKPSGFLFARWSAGAKAYEYSLPPEQRVIEDPYAPYYAGAIGRQMVAAMARINPSIRKGIVLRARYFDDYARQCLAEGFEQVVLLGAGYDSRYLRVPEFRAIQVYELDLASTQAIKKALTRRMLGKLPQNVKYVSIDFSQDSISQKLIGAGYDRLKRTLFIWEGVTLFLNKDIVCETLGRLAEFRPGNRVIFDFIPPELIDDATDYKGNRQLLKLCASINEPLTFGCDPKTMRDLLPGLGFSSVNVVDMREINRRCGGTEKIEDSYYFATAEVGANAKLFQPPIKGDGSCLVSLQD
ncbi:MAG: SAM-dependent methyltransferase [Candidatus Zixiibacteriota bacterium]